MDVAVEEAANVKVVEELDGIGDGDLASAKGFFRFRGTDRGDCDSRVRGLCGCGVPVGFQHENRFTQQVTNLLVTFISWRQAECLPIEAVGSFEVLYRKRDDFDTQKSEGRSVHGAVIT